MHSLRLAESNVSHLRSSSDASLWQLYEQLLASPQDCLQEAADFLSEQLHVAGTLACDLPSSPHELMAWMQQRTTAVTLQFQRYLQQRRDGAPRSYFTCRAHALYFLRAVGPTKLVDGAWLYGLLPYWRNAALNPLVRTYLEELGCGSPACNHVLIYRQLLASHGCDDVTGLDERHFHQGVLQLALGYLASLHVPEAIGFNLGYEQLPLHLLITAYELDELGIDPYYFKLHVTIDNAATGHAHKAVNAVLGNMPVMGDAKDYYRRVALGYRLNDVGTGSTAVIADFDIETEVVAMLERKRLCAQNVHSDYCRIDGRTVNEWLAGKESIALFLDALQRQGWIKRHADPHRSRFWQLVHGDRAAMFGVFTEYEQQLLHDWIAGDWLASPAQAERTRQIAVKRRRASLRPVDGGRAATHAERAVGPLQMAATQSAEDPELQALYEELARCDAARREQCLIMLAAPGLHWSPAGLKATDFLSRMVQP
jgi:hypothetical protein